ncbi:hypothetical protein Tco_1418343 [Tanacetum coccineum]
MRISRIFMLYMNCIGCFLSRIMNPQETEQIIARDELWVPTAERVNISTTNVRLETTVKQKEETFQVVIDVIKNSTCIKAFTISADVPEILMQQFWYTITKIKGSESYEFLLADSLIKYSIESRGKGHNGKKSLQITTEANLLIGLHLQRELEKSNQSSAESMKKVSVRPNILTKTTVTHDSRLQYYTSEGFYVVHKCLLIDGGGLFFVLERKRLEILFLLTEVSVVLQYWGGVVRRVRVVIGQAGRHFYTMVMFTVVDLWCEGSGSITGRFENAVRGYMGWSRGWSGGFYGWVRGVLAGRADLVCGRLRQVYLERLFTVTEMFMWGGDSVNEHGVCGDGVLVKSRYQNRLLVAISPLAKFDVIICNDWLWHKYTTEPLIRIVREDCPNILFRMRDLEVQREPGKRDLGSLHVVNAYDEKKLDDILSCLRLS